MGIVIQTKVEIQSSSAVTRWLLWLWGKFSGVSAQKGTLALVDQIIVSGTNFITAVMIGRTCGANELGIYTLGFTLVILIAVAQESLIATPYTIYGNRLERTPRAEYAGTLLVQYGFLSLLAIICLVAFGTVLSTGTGPASLTPVIWVLVGTIPFELLRQFFRRIAFAEHRMLSALILDLMAATLQLGGLFWLTSRNALSARTAFILIGFASAVAGLAWFVQNRNNFILRWAQLPQSFRRNWSMGKWVLAGRMVSSVNASVIYWLLALVLNAKATGVFTACMTVVMISNPLLIGMGNVLGPKTAQAFTQRGVGEVRHVVLMAAAFLSSMMVLFFVAVLIFGDVAVRLLYDGSEYVGHGHVIGLLALNALVASIGIAAYHGLLAIERPDVNLKMNLLGLGITLVVASFALTSWGVFGAAVAMLVGNIASTSVQFIKLLRLVK